MARNEDYYSQQTENNGTRDFLIGAVVGAIVGAATAIFLTPKSGKDIRHNLSSGAHTLKEKTVQLGEVAVDKGVILAEKAKEKSTSLGQAVSKQSSQLVSKVKGLKPETDQEESDHTTDSSTQGGTDIQRMLEETKRAFDETELQLNQ